jgi:hypothetical protein
LILPLSVIPYSLALLAPSPSCPIDLPTPEGVGGLKGKEGEGAVVAKVYDMVESGWGKENPGEITSLPFIRGGGSVLFPYMDLWTILSSPLPPPVLLPCSDYLHPREGEGKRRRV